MASEIADLYVVLRAVTTPYTTSMRRAAEEGNAFSSKTAGMGNALKQIGVVATEAGVAVAVASVKMASSFDQQMVLIHTQAHASGVDLKQLGDDVLALAPKVGIGPEKLAEGLYHVYSAGFKGKEAMDILAASARNAAIGQSDLETTTQALIGVMAVQLKDVKNAADAGNYLNTIVGTGDMRMQQLASAIATNTLPAFKSAGLGMRDFGAALATMTDNVTPADAAATRLRMSVAMLSGPTKAAKLALNSLGLADTQLGNDLRKPDGLMVAIMDLKKHLEQTYPAAKGLTLTVAETKRQLDNYAGSMTKAGVSAADQKQPLEAFRRELKQTGSAAVEQNAALVRAFGGGQTSGAILTLIAESDRLKSKYVAMGTAASRAAQAQKDWQEQSKQFHQQMAQLSAAVQVLMIKLGNFLIPYIQKFVGYLANHQGALKAVAIVIGVVLVAAIVAAGVAFVAATWEILLVIGAIAAVGAGIYWLWNHNKAFRDGVKLIWKDIQVAFKATWKAMEVAGHWFANNVLPLLKKAWQGFADLIRWFATNVLPQLETKWRQVWSFISKEFTAFKNGPGKDILKLINDISAWWKRNGDDIMAVVKFAWKWISSVIKVEVVGIWNAVKVALTMLMNYWRVVWGLIWDTIKIIWKLVYDNVSLVIHNIMNVITLVLDLIHGRWGKIWGDLKKLAGDAISGALKVVTDLFKGAGTLLYDAGKNIITGLINGIKSMLGAVGSTMSNVVSTVRNFLPFSPAKRGPLSGRGDPRFSGHAIVKSLADGLWERHELIEASMRKVAKVIHTGTVAGGWAPNVMHTVGTRRYGTYTEPVTSAAAAGGSSSSSGDSSSSGGSGGGTTTVTCNCNCTDRPIKLYLDGKEIYASVQKQALRHGRRNSSNGLSLPKGR